MMFEEWIPADLKIDMNLLKKNSFFHDFPQIPGDFLMKMINFRIKFRWNVLLRVKLKIN